MIATEEDIKFERFLRKRKDLIWKTKEGYEIPLNELTDKHLENIIRCRENQIRDSTLIKPSSLNFY